MRSERELDWVERYGETVTKTQAAKIMGLSSKTISRRVEEGCFQLTKEPGIAPRIWTDSLARYYETGKPQGISAVDRLPNVAPRKASRFRV